jgi:hypothetical protein
VRNKTLQKQIYKTDFKNHQIKRKKTPGWEADVSLPFLKVPTSQKILEALRNLNVYSSR